MKQSIGDNRIAEGSFSCWPRQMVGTMLKDDKMLYPYINCNFTYRVCKGFFYHYAILEFEDGTTYKSDGMSQLSIDKYTKFLEKEKLRYL